MWMYKRLHSWSIIYIPFFLYPTCHMCPRPNGFERNLRSKTRLFTGFCNLMISVCLEFRAMWPVWINKSETLRWWLFQNWSYRWGRKSQKSCLSSSLWWEVGEMTIHSITFWAQPIIMSLLKLLLPIWPQLSLSNSRYLRLLILLLL